MFLLKLYIGLSTNSIAIYTDALNNMLDSVTCVIAVIGFRITMIPKNEKYPFGYGRAEDIVTFLMSILVTVTGIVFIVSSFERLLYPTPVWFSVKYAVLTGITAAVKLLMAVFFGTFKRKHSSPVIKTMYLDSILDFFITSAALLSFTLSNYTNVTIDGFAGVVISIMVIAEGIRILVVATAKLMGKNNSDFIEKAAIFLNSYDSILSVDSVRCENFGEIRTVIVSVDISPDNAMNISEQFGLIKKEFADEFASELILSIGE